MKRQFEEEKAEADDCIIKLQAENAALKEVFQSKVIVLDQITNEKNEELQILTAQVNAYSRQGDELKRALVQSQEEVHLLQCMGPTVSIVTVGHRIEGDT